MEVKEKKQSLRKIPATVITGFLGSGKTSLIQHLISTANGLQLAFIINEFGDLRPPIITLFPNVELPAKPTCPAIIQFSPILTL